MSALTVCAQYITVIYSGGDEGGTAERSHQKKRIVSLPNRKMEISASADHFHKELGAD